MTDEELKQQWSLLNVRRSHLIRRKIYDGDMTMEEATELADLHQLTSRYQELVAPAPPDLDEKMEQLLKELKNDP